MGENIFVSCKRLVIKIHFKALRIMIRKQTAQFKKKKNKNFEQFTNDKPMANKPMKRFLVSLHLSAILIKLKNFLSHNY